MSKYLELNYSWNGGYFHELINRRTTFNYPISDIEIATVNVDKDDKPKFFINLEESVTYNNDISDLIAYHNPNWFLESIKFVEWQK